MILKTAFLKTTRIKVCIFLIDNQKWNKFKFLQRFRQSLMLIFKLFLFLSS